MTKSTITRERLEELAAGQSGFNLRIATHEESQELARMALAAMDSEPAAWTDEEELRDANESGSGYLFGIERDANKFADPRRQIMLYRHAQPAPVVPDAATAIRACLSEFPESARDIVEECADIAENACRAAMLHGADGKPELTVWYGAMPETNGKTNWTAILHRKGQQIWEGITIDRSEYPDRVRYEADRMRHLIGELPDEPDILSYDADAHSGYVKPGNSPVIPDGYVMVPKDPTAEMQSAGASAIRIETTALNKLWTGNAVFRAMLAAAPQEVKGE